ncbi:hypothetical protein [Phocaeicola vulgatus]|uniref:hypothetical protein n=1 Tax=Phocaeicola vulgatus TaxID=821 RepID=UPI001EDF4783|nr:hypothetical protein [Phocaeicola vulgatus]MCG4731822.1 hypothetical protein [Phocaeicola vulgatus]
MSDLNLENIVGFKAVDKDGNEQNVTVDEMVDMVSTRMVMALSETSTFAAAAATGNDVYENELPTVTDAANVRVLQSSGDAAKMTMQSLASKLGELLGINDTWLRFRDQKEIESQDELDQMNYSGIYLLSQKSKLEYVRNCVLVVIGKPNICCIQNLYNYSGDIYKYRVKWFSNSWGNWQTVS